MTKCVNENCDYYNEHGECSSVCENNGFTRIFTNYDRIRNMSVEELASFICSIYDYEYESPIYNETEGGKHISGNFIPHYNEDRIKRWLESEVTE